MDLLNNVNAENLFFAANGNQAQLESLANNALSRGVDFLMRKKYVEATKEFERSIGLSPHSQYSLVTSQYLANAYLQLGDTRNATKAYQTSINLNPQIDEPHIMLGNLLYAEKRYKEAEKEYREAVKLNPTNAGNHYYLGQSYLAAGLNKDAENEFSQVKKLDPAKPDGDFGLGLAFSNQGRYEDAIRHFKEAITINKEFYDAYAEMGYAYADSGQMDEAMEILEFLKEKEPVLADSLSRYAYKVDPPKLMFASYNSTFMHYMPSRTPVSALDAYLENANTAKQFSMVFQFDKEMDRASVENRFNWKISRSSGSGPGQAYNFGRPIPSTEIKINPYPTNIYYDPETLTATIKFNITQNATSSGTIDPSHIEFMFTGKDKFGFSMDPDKDQFTNFSGTY